MELWEIFLFVVVVVVAFATFSVMAYLADALLRKKFGKGIVPKDYYK